MPEGENSGPDVRTIYGQFVAIANLARLMRQRPETCSPDEVDGILRAYGSARTQCQITYDGRPPISLHDLGRLDKEKRYTTAELRSTVTDIEVECFKAVSALAKVISLIPKEEAHRK